MSVFAVSPNPKTHHRHLPAYAGFILENFLEDFTKRQLDLCFSEKIPVLEHFALIEEEELVTMFRLRSVEALKMLSQHKHEEQAHQAIKRWLQVRPEAPEDYTTVSQFIVTICFIQKQAFLDFVTRYTQDPADIIEVVREIDFQFLKLESVAISKISDTFRRRQIQQALITEKVVPAMVFTYDLAACKLSYFNKKVSDFLGYSNDMLREAGSDIILQVIHPDDLALIAERGIQLIETSNDVSVIECRVKDKNGIFRLLQVHVTVAERSEGGQVLSVSGVAQDFTLQREMENDLKHKSFMLDQSNANLEEFAYIASHDLKEPLRKISTFGDRLLERQRDNLNEEGKIYLDKMMSACKRMQVMISDLLSISRVSSNKEFSLTDLNVLLEEALQSLGLVIERKKAVIQAEMLPQLHIVPSQVRQLFQQILNNSLKFCKPEVTPRIRITVRQLNASERDQFRLCSSKQYLRIDFIDNGIGFDNQFSEKIFTIFQRLHGKNEYEGSGIGLTICKKIMDNHGGVICASGKPGEGSIFSTIFPI